jgi:hypothetical protein
MADLWKELHLRALNFEGDNDTAYLLEFAQRIPQYSNCSCREHWRKIVQTNPPKFGKNGEYFAWTVQCHNKISELIGKPTFTVEKAREYYSQL